MFCVRLIIKDRSKQTRYNEQSVYYLCLADWRLLAEFGQSVDQPGFPPAALKSARRPNCSAMKPRKQEVRVYAPGYPTLTEHNGSRLLGEAVGIIM